MTSIAIVGQGAMARAHAKAWSEIGLSESISFVCGRSEAVPLDGAPRARFVTDLDVILRDQAVTIVSVCTPTPTHAEIAIRCLTAGKNVLLEKPIALTLTDAQAISEVAASSDGVLMVAHVVRFFDGYRAIREQAEAGVLGTILTARAQRFSPAPQASSWWHDESKSGGVLVDFSIHDFDQLNVFLGRPLAVSARRARPDGPFEVAVDYERGCSGQVLSFMGMPAGFSFASSIELLGSRGIADYRFGGSLGESGSDGDSYQMMTAAGALASPITRGNPYAAQARYFLDCVERNAAPEFCPTDSAVLALAVSLAARESYAAGRVVEVRSV
ncbi:MAG: Gfo/Idh/MocA family oxidoreductase [Lacisediminihabitans sp.]